LDAADQALFPIQDQTGISQSNKALALDLPAQAATYL